MSLVGSLFRPVRGSTNSACSTSSCWCFASSSISTLSPIRQLAVVFPSRLTRSGNYSHAALQNSTRKYLLGRSGLRSIISWEGRSHLGFMGRGRHWQSRRGPAGRVHASLFGVGAPEALVIAIVALVVFGPKGLAEVARTLGKSLKAFQPTIQELQQVSKEFRNTLEQEIGLDELRNPKPTNTFPLHQQPQPARKQNGAPDGRASTSEDFLKVTDEQGKVLVPDDPSREAEAAARSTPTPPRTAAEDATQEES